MVRRITDEDVRRAAALAKLELRQEELPGARRDLEDMLGAIEALRMADIPGTTPMYSVEVRSCSLREDVPGHTSGSIIPESVRASIVERATTLPPPEWKRSQALSKHNTPGTPDQTSSERSRDSLHPGETQP